MKLAHSLMVGLAALTLSACSSRSASDLYVLRAADENEAACKASGRTLIIQRPAAPDAYDSKRIPVMLGRNHLSFYTGANWASPFPEQLQEFMTNAFLQQGVQVVEGGSDDADASSILRITILDASINDVSAPVVNLKLTGTVTNAAGKRVTRFRVNERIAASENHMPHIIDAYGIAATNAANTIAKAMKLRCN